MELNDQVTRKLNTAQDMLEVDRGLVLWWYLEPLPIFGQAMRQVTQIPLRHAVSGEEAGGGGGWGQEVFEGCVAVLALLLTKCFTEHMQSLL